MERGNKIQNWKKQDEKNLSFPKYVFKKDLSKYFKAIHPYRISYSLELLFYRYNKMFINFTSWL